jgi:hypothetical protein
MNLQSRDLKLDTTKALTGPDVATLQTELGHLGYSILPAESGQQSFGASTRDAVVKFQTDQHLAPTGVVEATTAAAINRVLDASTYVVSGRVASQVNAAVKGLQVQLFDHNVGQDAFVAATTTDARGHYQISVVIPPSTLQQRRKTLPDFQVRIFAGRTQVGASEVRYHATNAETLDVLIAPDATGLPSEHEVLTGSLGELYAGRLGDLKETADQQDITYLANKTGWDARAVALAALADQFSARTVTAPGRLPRSRRRSSTPSSAPGSPPTTT